MRHTRLGRPRATTVVAFVVGIALAAVLLPAGVTAASSKDVFAFITDPIDPTRQATVTSDSALKVVSSGTATVSGTVNVGNFPAAAQPFQEGTGDTGTPIEDGEGAGVGEFNVPAGKRLVIQHVSGQITLPSGQEPFGLWIDTSAGGSFERHFLDLPKQRPVPIYFQYGEEITINADPGTTVRIVVSRLGSSTAGAGNFQWAISGYLTNA